MGETQGLTALQRRVDGWRRTGGGRGSRIPQDIWAEAVSVAQSAGLHATARALRFNYENLKKRALAARKAPPPRKQAMEFVALPMPQLPNGLKVLIDLAAPDGQRMRIEVSGGSAAEVGTLAHALWRGHP
jgi:hypothetical protein